MNKRKLIVPILIAIVLATHAPLVLAQCNITYFSSPINSTQGTPPPRGIGQSFTACQTGFVAWITVFSTASSDVPVVLGTQAGMNINVLGNPQDVVLQGGANHIELAIPLPVTVGMTYSFGIFPTDLSADLALNHENPYAEGMVVLWSPQSGTYTFVASDLLFGVEILPYNPVSNELTTWGAVKGLYR